MGRRHLCLALATVVTLATQSVSAHAQWNHRAPETPRLRDGTPNLSAPAPRASTGKPDFSGTWQVQGSPISELRQLFPGGENGLGESVASKYFINILADFTPDNAPIQPEAAALYARRSAVFGKDGPITRCLPASIPNAELLPHPHKIVQTSRLLVVLYEMNTSFRQIFLDGRKRPDDPQPAWLGYSIGKWDGDWLVVDTMGFNDRGWLDAFGHSHSDVLHVVERFHRRDFGHLDVQVTIEDPKTFTKPFTIKFTERLMADSDLIESVCQENERDAAHLKDR